MNSPVEIPFRSFIQLKPEDNTALYLQIVFEFIKAIQTGFFPEGTKLPGKRILCKVLSVNRNTLIKAFQDLESQGWIETLPNKGTFILSQQKQKNKAELTAFMKVFTNLNKFEHKGSFEGWIRRIMVNECISYLRVQKKVKFLEDEFYVEDTFNNIESHFSVEDIQTLIDGLPDG